MKGLEAETVRETERVQFLRVRENFWIVARSATGKAEGRAGEGRRPEVSPQPQEDVRGNFLNRYDYISFLISIYIQEIPTDTPFSGVFLCFSLTFHSPGAFCFLHATLRAREPFRSGYASAPNHSSSLTSKVHGVESEPDQAGAVHFLTASKPRGWKKNGL
ncbi:hypothetical protein XM53_18315 [Roseovarius atlanticus]|uniref:Uncharacterized protein n=1 Tax=Roseovarius atlanticus TaxID=1641875 RepID=A0A0T5NQ44_9RHOB|nr:hypothetical protein [Roseovarius atlanticus]KRS11034.1 hypothetical protein XM53_18315 [Roseovarius atlanticus]